MSVSDANPYIVTMPPVQVPGPSDFLERYLKIIGRKTKKNKGQGDSRNKARDDADDASSNDGGKIEALEKELKEVETAIPKLVEDIARSVANKVYDERLEIIDPEDPSDVPNDPLREERKAVRDSKESKSRRNKTEEVRSDLYRERKDGSRQRYDPPSGPDYPGTPWRHRHN